MVKPNLRATAILLFSIFECFNLGIETITSLDTSKWKFQTYAFCQENTTPMARSWWFMITLWWKDSHLNALIMCHLKRQYNWRSRVFCMQNRNSLCLIACTNPSTLLSRLRECSGSVVECLTRDREAAGLSLTGVTALWSLSKTHLS